MSLNHDSRANYLVAKKARQNIEDETRLIENRIRMIKFEEERSNKRIQETREKIEEIYKARSRFIEEKHNRNLAKEKEIKSLSDIKNVLKSNRCFRQEKIHFTQGELFSIKQNMGNRVRGWKEYIKRNVQQQIIEQKRRNRQLKEAVDFSNRQGSLRLKLLNDIKEKKAKFNYLKKVENENFKRKEVEGKIGVLEKDEEEIMERIARANEEQQRAERLLQELCFS